MEASLRRRLLYPIYWPAEPRCLLRGTWFVETGQDKGWLPLLHPVATALETQWQLRYAGGSGQHVQYSSFVGSVFRM
jgi:hypothetical protein